MKEFADDNFKFDENERKLSKQVENTEGKGEIAHYQACFLVASKGVIMWKTLWECVKDNCNSLSNVTFDLRNADWTWLKFCCLIKDRELEYKREDLRNSRYLTGRLVSR